MRVSREFEIEWGDCDAAGIVFYPRYFAYFDACSSRLFDRALGMKKREWIARYGLIGTPMVDTRASFRAPCRFSDVVRVDTEVARLGGASIEISHKLYNGDVLAVEAWEKRVWTGRRKDDPNRLAALPIPEDVRARLLAD